MSTKDTSDPERLISLKGGGYATVSICDFDAVSKREWRLGSNGYIYLVGGRKKGVPCLLHRIVFCASSGMDIHHKNEDKTDCTRGNLEQLSRSDHQLNHSHLVSARNRASRKYSDHGVCKSCGETYLKHPDHRSKQNIALKDARKMILGMSEGENEMKPENNIPAFPAPDAAAHDYGDSNRGMYRGLTIRDYFAAKAMQALLHEANTPYGLWSMEAESAYEIADAMLEARK